ncbi:leukotriene B4 receptor 1-like [Chelonia mydas]|uniref:G-protein coupled receptor 1 n=1 Tax=Chelonia mydas TaxID=8469 RepID=M7C9E3_CHEMY|nr:leukotriene B4 receptor 1-like [Chelonia mydas]EMP41253.1 G-protein coupled receptor 1 [Chelonia mydas]
MNRTEENSHLTWDSERSVVCTILSLSFAIGIPGNSIVIWTICGKVKQRSPTVMLILNLAISDILVLVTLPVWIYSFANTWLFGVTFCKTLVSVVYCSMYASVFIITTLSLERFMAVFYPFMIQRWKNKAVILKVVFLIWLLSVAFGASIIPFQEIEETKIGQQCTYRNYTSDQQKILCLLLETIVGFVIPFVIISTCYVCVERRINTMTYSSRQRSARLIASVIVAFAVCWLPHHLFNIIEIVSTQIVGSNQKMSLALDEVSEMGVYISGSLAFISSCINPLLYAFAARNFQSHLRFAKMFKLFETMTSAVREEAQREMSV